LSRRVVTATVLLVVGGLLSAGSPASAQQPLGVAPDVPAFGHDDSLDGTPNERVSGFFGGDDGDNSNGNPLQDRDPLTFEAFEFRVPPGSEIGSFTVTVSWQDPRLDFDLYIYRKDPVSGTIAPAPIAQSAAFGDNDEAATYYNAISSNAVEPDTYIIVVDNWCTSNTDPGASFAFCGIGDANGNPVAIPDEDDFVGNVTFGPKLASNPLPTATIAGPDVIKEGATATFMATGADPGGAVRNFSFDLDGDGRFEADNGMAPTITRRFETAGRFNVGVRVNDDQGGQSFASRLLTVQAPAIKQLLARFYLNRPVFGGDRQRRALRVYFRLRERSKVTLDLYRGKTRVRRLVDNKTRAAKKLHTVTIRARGKRRGAYTVRISATSETGRTQKARLAAKRL
jgi:hypothetical protein